MGYSLNFVVYVEDVDNLLPPYFCMLTVSKFFFPEF